MAKKFALSLIAISTLVYSSIFFLSVMYNTRFFDEILIQLNRMTINMSNTAEIQHSRLILNTILDNDQPPENWQTLVVNPPKNDPVQLFYFYKIWTIKSGLSKKNVKGSYPIFMAEQNHLTIINIRYGKKKPILQFPFSRTPQGQLVSGLFFAVNELPFSADLNSDSIIDQKDVLLARKQS